MGASPIGEALFCEQKGGKGRNCSGHLWECVDLSNFTAIFLNHIFDTQYAEFQF